MQFKDGQHIHLVGIGGFGISAIARILLERGFEVSGSDRNSNALTQALARDGATIHAGHQAAYIEGADMLIVSSAIPDDHVEVEAARERGVPVYKRRDVLAALTEGQRVVAVAGTHGKTTTTSMIVHILRENDFDPSYIVGGVMANTGTNAGVGQGDVFVIEADEYDYMFLGLRPDVIVVTGVEYDHPDFFESWVMLRDAFHEFIELLPEDGVLIGCGDDATTEALLSEQKRQAYANLAAGEPGRTVISYGADFLDFVDVLGWQQHIDPDGYTSFDCDIEGRLFGTLARVRLPLVGKHNIQNALAAITATNVLRVAVPDVAAALETYKSTGRRFEVRGSTDGLTVVDDYAHHPTAIKLTLEAARMRYPEAAVYAVWQPHMFSRTQRLLDDYAAAFNHADAVIVTDIYPAREAPILGVDGAAAAAALQHPSAQHIAGFEAVAEWLAQNAASPAVVVIMSAGDAPEIGARLLELVGWKK